MAQVVENQDEPHGVREESEPLHNYQGGGQTPANHGRLREPSRLPHGRSVGQNPSIPSNPEKRPDLVTRSGHRLDEATSALQKAIRRSDLDGAGYWTAEMMDRYPHHVWRRLRTITSEDVGVAWPEGPAVIVALHQAFEQERAEKRGNGSLALMHAALLLARARKSRLVVHALLVHSTDPEHREVPDVALDKHTKAGRELGRGMAHFFEEAALLADPGTGELTAEGSIPDPYLDRARKALGGDR